MAQNRITAKDFREKYGADTNALAHDLALQDKKRSEAVETIVNKYLVLPYPPSLNMMYPTNRTGKRYLSTRGQRFKKAAIDALTKQRAVFMTGELTVVLRLYRPKKQGDIDNYSKGVFDAMKGICFEDDKQICELHIYRYDDKTCPRVEVEITKKGDENERE